MNSVAEPVTPGSLAATATWAPSAPPARPDFDLVARAQQGDEAAFDALYHKHKRHVYHLCLHMVGRAAEAEELTQEAFMQVFRKMQTFRGDSAFSTWLHRLAVNVVLMRLRRRTVTETPFDDSNDSEEFNAPPRDFGAPDLSLNGVVDRVCLKRAIAKLPPGYRAVFILHDVLGCEHHEVADRLGYSIGNSKSQLHKARLRLRKLLGRSLRHRRLRRTPKAHAAPANRPAVASRPAIESEPACCASA